ncbi:MAG: sugar transferase [Deltaproteobacteria bacterium]|nr:MAG: sugar transferase [Deltaproteobacteria bacterium]TMQ22659.1 MAG: sugar transferase [Deltaproteobacteria bacterium]
MKRLIDVTVAASLLVLGAPVFAATALLVYADVGRPLLFRQRRVGLGGRVFELVKFRTMRSAVDRDGRPLPDAARLTRIGRLIRASSLDELPQLINVLRGDMSLVGPRPLLVEYLSRYSPEQARRHEVQPGITGLAQVAGRNALSWPEKFALDIYYVDHRSLALDLQILARTVAAVVKREGISAAGEATMPPFRGER